MTGSRLLPDIVTITPTSYDDHRRCGRLYLDRHLLGIPDSDVTPSTEHGLLLHDLLRLAHEDGSVHDPAHVADVVAAQGADPDRYIPLIERHARRCPVEYEASAHEVALARFHRAPPPLFMATARIDALYVHDGLLDARDYKSGRAWHDRVADDPRARVQAWVLGREARRRNLRVHLRYEYLAAEVDDDPEPWEPDDDDLADVAEELRAWVASLPRDPDGWIGVADAGVCRTCGYRSICPDSASPGQPMWPILSPARPARDGQAGGSGD